MQQRKVLTFIIDFWVCSQADPYSCTYYSEYEMQYPDYLDHEIMRRKASKLPKWELNTYAENGFNGERNLLVRSYFHTRKQAKNYIPVHEKIALK